MANETDINKIIVKLVHDSWKNATGKPLLLSQLGSINEGHIGQFARQSAGGLEKYLSINLHDQVQIIYHSLSPLVKFAIPKDVNLESFGGPDKLLESISYSSSQSPPRFYPAFWTAFRKPLEESKRRFIRLKSPVWFEDLDSEPPQEHFVEIVREYLVDSHTEDHLVFENASKWLQDNDLERDLFVSRQQPKTAVTSVSRNVLDKILFSLSDTDLENISLPLNVIKALRNTRV